VTASQGKSSEADKIFAPIMNANVTMIGGDVFVLGVEGGFCNNLICGMRAFVEFLWPWEIKRCGLGDY
jgi:hypothetical protein